jgi:pantetheine-phosphate adenylyltransferase
MKTNAIYPGTFDPITFGHIDVIKKSLKIVDKVIVAISDINNKNYLFSAEERIEIVKKALFSDLKLNKKRVKVILFNSLTTSLCKKNNANIILRGLRAVSDFEYEVQLASMNRSLSPAIESVFMSPAEKYSFLSSSIIKDIARHHGNIDGFVHQAVATALKNKFE